MTKKTDRYISVIFFYINLFFFCFLVVFVFIEINKYFLKSLPCSNYFKIRNLIDSICPPKVLSKNNYPLVIFTNKSVFTSNDLYLSSEIGYYRNTKLSKSLLNL